MKKERETQEALDATLLYEIPTGEAKELPPDSAWDLWDLTVRLQDYEERHHDQSH